MKQETDSGNWIYGWIALLELWQDVRNIDDKSWSLEDETMFSIFKYVLR